MEGEKLYDHQLDEDKWEKLREGIRYEGHEDGAGRQWTYESDQEYRDAQRQKGNGGNGSGSGSGQGNGQGNGSGTGANPPPQDNSPPPPSSSPPSASSSSLGGIGALGYILIGVLVIALMFLIYYLFVNSNSKGKKVTAVTDIQELNPTEIPLSELQRLLQEALARKDYRGAVRIYFIFVIRGLATKKWISWEKEKTNFDYLREMSGKSEFDDFNRSVSFFEFIWYGERQIDELTFEKIKPGFTSLLNKLEVD